MNKLNACGFTLIELMVGVAVLAIALGAGVPSMSEFIENSCLSAQTNDLLASLHLARTEAIKRSARITLCAKRPDAVNCNPVAGTGWQIGWVVFVDVNNNRDLDAGEPVLDSHGAAANRVSITPSIGNLGLFFYTPRGVLRYPHPTAVDAAGVPLSVALNGVFRICDGRGLDHARGLVLSPTGRAEFTKSTTVIGTCP